MIITQVLKTHISIALHDIPNIPENFRLTGASTNYGDGNAGAATVVLEGVMIKPKDAK